MCVIKAVQFLLKFYCQTSVYTELMVAFEDLVMSSQSCLWCNPNASIVQALDIVFSHVTLRFYRISDLTVYSDQTLSLTKVLVPQNPR